MSSQIIAVIVTLLATGLPLLGVTVGSEDLTKTIQVIVTIASGIWIWYQRTTLQKAVGGVGDVTALGQRR